MIYIANMCCKVLKTAQSYYSWLCLPVVVQLKPFRMKQVCGYVNTLLIYIKCMHKHNRTGIGLLCILTRSLHCLLKPFKVCLLEYKYVSMCIIIIRLPWTRNKQCDKAIIQLSNFYYSRNRPFYSAVTGNLKQIANNNNLVFMNTIFIWLYDHTYIRSY